MTHRLTYTISFLDWNVSKYIVSLGALCIVFITFQYFLRITTKIAFGPFVRAQDKINTSNHTLRLVQWPPGIYFRPNKW